MKKRMVYLLLSSAALSAVLSASFRAQALTEVARGSAFRCALLDKARYSQPVGLDVDPSGDDQTGIMGIESAVMNTPRAKVACPIDDIASMASSISSVTAHIEDNSSGDNAWAIACTQFSVSEGGSCAAGKHDGGVEVTGEVAITVSTNWATEAAKGFPYLYVELPFGGPRSAFKGYTASKN
jgi:hypothetical protein